jgi:hypothetical protein
LVGTAQDQALQSGPESEGEPIEEVEVTWQTSRLALRAEIGDSGTRMFDLTPHIPGSKAGGGKSLSTRGAPETEQQLWFRNKRKHEAFNTNFRELATQHHEGNALHEPGLAMMVHSGIQI